MCRPWSLRLRCADGAKSVAARASGWVSLGSQTCCGPRRSVAGKGEAKGHSLPVVAMGSIPHIYRRDSFSHRATPERLPRTRSRESCFSSPLKNTELFHAKQTEFMKRPIAQLIIVGGPLALEFHATESPANPRVKLLEEPATSREAGGKVVRRALKNSIKFLDDQLGFEVMMPHSQVPHLVFEFLQGLGPHAARARREHKPKEGVTLAKGSNACLLSTQMQTECGQDLPHKVQRAFRLGIRVANDDKVVRVAHEVKASCVQLPVELIEDDVSQEGRDNAPLRRADCSRLKDTVLHHTRPEKFLDKTQDVAVGDFGRQRLHDDRLRQVIKEGSDIRI